MLLIAALLALPAAQAGASIASTPFPGSTPVAQSSVPLTVVVSVTQPGTAQAPAVVTQGISGLDFQMAPGGTCAGGVAYGTGQQCTVNVVFSPRYPGVRSGAVILESTTGTVLGMTLLNGTGTGGLSVLTPGTINTVAGDQAWIYNGDGEAATQASIFLPTGVVVDAGGNLYISDSNNARIRRVDATSQTISTIAGTGSPGYSGDGGPATQAEISTPAAIVIDGAGDLYFADTGNHAIRRIDAVTRVITTVAGTPTDQGYSGDGGAATSATLSLPEGLGFDSAQNLYIADTGNNAIRLVSAASGRISTYAGTGAAGYSGDGGAAASARLNSPWNVSIGSDGSLYIADFANNAIRKVASGIISTVVGNGTAGFSGDSGPPTSAELDEPASVVFDPAGNMYIADSGNNRVREVFVTAQTIVTITGIDSEEFSGDGGPANLAALYGPYSLYMDQTGNLVIADMFHNRVRTISANSVSLAYPTMRVGKVSAPQLEELSNDGNAGMTLAAPTFNNSALDPATTTCNTGDVVASGTSCQLGVEFAPTVTGDPVLGTLDANSNAGNSPSVINLSGQVLSVNPTSLSLTSSVNPSLVGAPVTFTATITSGGTGLTGTVIFDDGSTQICSVALASNGSATCTTSSLTLGQHNITANYSGDADDASAVSPVLVQVVQQATTLNLTAAPNPATVTASVTLTATATAPTGTPTGTVTFYDGGTAIGSANLNSGGTATFSTTQLAAGTHNLSAQYSGNPTDAATQSNTVSEVVNLAATNTTLSTSAATVTVGTSITLSSTVTSTNGPVPTGTVTFSSGTTTLGTGTLNSSGSTTIVLSTLGVGSYGIIATYSGDADNATSVSPTVNETVQQIPTTTSLISSANPASAGATVTFTAATAVASGATADGAITGTVTFTDGATTLGTSTLNASGQATLAVSALSAGTHSILATYNGSTNYATSSSAALSQQIQNTPTTTVLSVPSPTSLAGEPITFTMNVSSSTGIPTGTVVIRDSGTAIGQGTLNGSGVATFTTSTLPVGTHTLTAAYGGDTNYLSSTSAPVQETVSLATTGLTLAGPSAPVNAGTVVNLTAALTSNGIAPTGTLTLSDGGVAIATQTVSAAGTFTFSTSTLAVGTHTLTAAYGGNSDNQPATSNAVSVVVQQGPTATSLTTSANPSTIGQSVTLSSSVTSVSPSITGTITFEDGSTVLSTVALSDGTATFTTSSLSFGTHNLTAVYSGDTNHATSTSAVVAEQIVQPAAASLSSSYNPSVSGASVTFTARITGVGATIPTGNVTFSDGATVLGTVTLDGTGTAAFATTGLAVGTHTITVSYPGDKNYSTASASLTQTVQNASTQITLTSSANPATYLAALTFTATIVSNGGTATGTVTFTDGAVTIGSGTLNASGVATFTTSTLAPGVHSIVANYAGDGRASASVSAPLAQTVKELTSTALLSSANPSPTVSGITFTATVTNSGVGVPTGTVTFTDGGTELGTATLSGSGQASLSVPSMSAGTHTIVASYAGDGTNFSSTSSALTETVQLRPTTTSLSYSNTSATDTQQVTLIAVVRWNGPTTPSGTVTFSDASGSLGSATVDSTGTATLTIELQAPTESITATYSGDSAYSGSASAATNVSAGLANHFTLTVSPSTMSLQTKQHAVLTVTASSLQGFTDSLQLGCLGLPYAATCTFSDVQVTLAANGTSTVQLTLDTSNPLGEGAQASNRSLQPSNVMLCMLPGTLLAGLLFFRRRRSPWRSRLLPLLLLVCAVALTFGATGCGGLQGVSTPPGSYSFRVTASGIQSGYTETQVLNLTVTQ